MEDTKKSKIEFTNIKSTITEIKNIHLMGLETVEDKIGAFKDTALESIQR